MKYEEAKKHGNYAIKPQIRKYDKVYNGKLRIIFGERNFIKDSDSAKLEDRLGDILIKLYDKSEENRIIGEIREAVEHRRAEEVKKKEKKVNRPPKVRVKKSNFSEVGFLWRKFEY